MITEIKNLNGIKGGLHKHWPLKNKSEFAELQSKLQQIAHSIEDLNRTLKNRDNFDRKDIVFCVVATLWIQEAVNEVVKMYNEQIIKKFTFSRAAELLNQEKYLSMMSSIIISKPLATTEYSSFGFDGDLYCVDMTYGKTIIMPFKENVWHTSVNGFDNKEHSTDDCFLHVYSKQRNSISLDYIGFSLDELLNISKTYIDKIYELDSFLLKQKKV